ncbi:MAG: carbohydrate binding domain-containing protein [Armatimonadetes bacterium]|nr:carbohydrate binding domain-containing protein [Armatimonadota bacterium]
MRVAIARPAGSGLWLLPVLAAIAMPPAGSANLILDGSSFETGYDGYSCLLAYAWTKYGLAASDPRRGTLDTTTAAHGRCSLKLAMNPPFGREGFSPWCTFRWIPVKEGTRYTVSLYAKGSHAGQRLTVSVSDAWQDWGWSTFTLSTEWQRYNHTITAGKTVGGYAWVLIPFTEDGPAWIDGVQLEEGDLTDYAPGRPVDLGLSCNYPGNCENLFNVGDQVVLHAAVFNDLAQRSDVRLRYAVEDYFGRIPFRGAARVVAEARAGGGADIDLGAVLRGSYKAKVTALDADGKTLDEEELVFGVVRRRRAATGVESQFGMHGFPHDLVGSCGVRWIRTYLLAWQAVEPEQGKFSWPEERPWDQLFLEQLDKLHIDALPVLQAGPKWAMTGPPTHGGWAKDQSDGAKMPDLEAWRNYVYQAVSRYKGRFHSWEVMNEPSAWLNAEDYFPILKTAYEAAKQADPACRIIAGDSAWKDQPFLRELLDRGGADYLDIYCGHFYGVAQAGPPEVKYGKEGADAVIANLREALGRHGKPNVPMWNTEEGTISPPWYAKEIVPSSHEPWHRVPSARRQAQDMVRSHLIELGNGIEKVFWFYELYGEQAAAARWIIRPEGMYGCEFDGAPRPELIAYSVMTEMLEGATPFGREPRIGDKIHCFVFTRGRDAVAAIWYWGTEPESVTVTLPAAPSFRVSDLMGNAVRPAPKLRLDGNPLYLVARGRPAQELFDALSQAKVVAP